MPYLIYDKETKELVDVIDFESDIMLESYKAQNTNHEVLDSEQQEAQFLLFEEDEDNLSF